MSVRYEASTQQKVKHCKWPLCSLVGPSVDWAEPARGGGYLRVWRSVSMNSALPREASI